ncbi:MAG TPA: hypothetical protein VHE32_10635 [Rhodanobacteraceae bacterium]|nr:hypothetical protein [Rhodanobacteraceae bacterium]
MPKYSLWLLLFLSTAALADTSDADFNTAVDAHRYAIHVDGSTLGGEGAKRILDEGRTADFFLFGENHGAHEIAAFADALYLGTSTDGSRRLVTEIGPATATELETMLRDGSYRSYLAEGVHLLSVPFFFWEDELPLAENVVKANPPGVPAIWGLDQEFVAGAPVVLHRLDALATTDAERNAIASARRSAFWNPLLFGMGSDGPVKALRDAFGTSANAEARKLTEEIELGFRLYKEQSDGGDWKWSNERRETLMMDHFLDYVQKAGGDPGRLFFKLGAFHLMRGESPAVTEALGLRLSRWAADHGKKTVNVFVDCRGGELRDVVLGRAAPCDSYLDGDADVFGPHLVDSGTTLFDLRPLRDLPALKQMPKRAQRIVANYDWYIAVTNTHASTFLPGHLATLVYGGTIAVCALAVVVLLIAWIVRRIRRRRRARRAEREGFRAGA